MLRIQFRLRAIFALMFAVGVGCVVVPQVWPLVKALKSLVILAAYSAVLVAGVSMVMWYVDRRQTR
jgi:hypothetical protein